MKCKNCGTEIGKGIKFCPKCGTALAKESAASTAGATPVQQPNSEPQKVVYVKHKGYWSTGRLTIGIVSILLFIFITFQSCAAGLGNALMENGASSGTQGVFTALCYLIAGIVGIASRNSLAKGGAMQFTELSGRCSVFERPLSDAKRPLFF